MLSQDDIDFAIKLYVKYGITGIPFYEMFYDYSITHNLICHGYINTQQARYRLTQKFIDEIIEGE